MKAAESELFSHAKPDGGSRLAELVAQFEQLHGDRGAALWRWANSLNAYIARRKGVTLSEIGERVGRVVRGRPYGKSAVSHWLKAVRAFADEPAEKDLARFVSMFYGHGTRAKGAVSSRPAEVKSLIRQARGIFTQLERRGAMEDALKALGLQRRRAMEGLA